MSYAIIQDARFTTEGVNVLALAKQDNPRSKYWTSYVPNQILEVSNLLLANKILSKLKFNNPRIISYDKALEMIEEQNKLANLLAITE